MQDRSRPDAHLTWVNADVGAGQRCASLNLDPMTLWLTGFSGSGKSTLAFRLETPLLAAGKAAFVLDGGMIRKPHLTKV